MIKIEIQGVNELQKAFNVIGQRWSDLRWVWPPIIDIFYERETQLFSSQGEGEWQQLSPRYAAWKQQHFPGKPLLVASGNLRDSLTGSRSPFSVMEMQPRSLAVGTSVPYARYHQLGTSRMPARPPIIIDDATLNRMLEVAMDMYGLTAEDLGFEVKK